MWKVYLRSRTHVRVQDLCVPVPARILRTFCTSGRRAAVQPFILSDPGEGIKEVQIIQWFVEPGARVEQFDKIVEVQTDKAINEITSRYDGVIKKLHYERDDVVQVGQALLDIDVQGQIIEEDGSHLEKDLAQPQYTPSQPQSSNTIKEQAKQEEASASTGSTDRSQSLPERNTLATPAVRGLLKELKVDIQDVQGTGRDGRVTKEDVHKFVNERDNVSPSPPKAPMSNQSTTMGSQQLETSISLTPIQSQMFKTMTKSLRIPHFLYADEVDVTALKALREVLNGSSKNIQDQNAARKQKLSFLPFIVKAVSIALEDFPILNARLEENDGSNDQPQLVMRQSHNIGIAMDTPQGLLVPNIKDVRSQSISAIASETAHLQSLAKDSKLTSKHLSGGTITVSNIGSIGGTYVSPIIVPTEVAILGLGKARTVPRFIDTDTDTDSEYDGTHPAERRGDRVVKRTIMQFSWSADHRVVDGATMARMAERVKELLEVPGRMLARMN